MKKILLTTSALTLLAGAAAADATVSGYARIGVQNSGTSTSNYLRNRLTFTGSATSDGGITLSTWQRFRTSAANSKFSGSQGFSAPSISMSNGAMTLAAGNTGGAINKSGIFGCGAAMWGCDDVVGAGIWDWASGSSTGAGPNVVRLDMSLGSAVVHVSGGNGNDTEASVTLPMGGGSLGVGYDAGSPTAAVVAAAATNAVAGTTSGTGTAGVYVAGSDYVAAVTSAAAISAKPTIVINYSGTMAGMGVGVRMSQSNSKTGYIANVSSPVASGSIYIFAGKNLLQKNVYGLRYDQTLGGGVSMQAGATSNDGKTTVGAGIAFGF